MSSSRHRRMTNALWFRGRPKTQGVWPWSMGLCVLTLVGAAATGCNAPVEPGIRQGERGVYGGTPSSLEGVAVVIRINVGGICGGAVVGPRHVLLPDFCVSTAGDMRVFSGASLDLNGSGQLVDRIELGPVVDSPGQEDIHAALVITRTDLPVAPLGLVASSPGVGAGLRLLGYAPDGSRNEGPIEVTEVFDATFVGQGAEGVSGVVGFDGTAVDASGLLVGLVYMGVPATVGVDPLVFASVAPLRAFIEGVVGVPAGPDAGVEGDAGSSGDAGAADAGPEPGDGGEEGCGCRSSGSGGPVPLLPLPLLLLCGLLWTRRHGAGRRRPTAG